MKTLNPKRLLSGGSRLAGNWIRGSVLRARAIVMLLCWGAAGGLAQIPGGYIPSAQGAAASILAVSVGDASYTFAAGVSEVDYTTAFTASRTLTFPAASSVSAGSLIYILDPKGVVFNNYAVLTLTPNATIPDTIVGQSSLVLNGGSKYMYYVFKSDGLSNWSWDQQVIAPQSLNVYGNSTFGGAASFSTRFYFLSPEVDTCASSAATISGNVGAVTVWLNNQASCTLTFTAGTEGEPMIVILHQGNSSGTVSTVTSTLTATGAEGVLAATGASSTNKRAILYCMMTYLGGTSWLCTSNGWMN